MAAGFLALIALQSPQADSVPTLGLERGTLTFTTPAFELELVESSQTVAALRPLGADGFDFTPGDWLERRAADGYYHLGDLSLVLRAGDGSWRRVSTAEDRNPVTPLPASPPLL
ncbi:MAG: DUF5695 domain-containing protein, partial [Candidatus Palauibacterales bacterium]|nr:DUF5695 domain-containing protein [Candidatus Palauibacterales bacterium]